MKTKKLQNSKFIRQGTIQPHTHRIANTESVCHVVVLSLRMHHVVIFQHLLGPASGLGTQPSLLNSDGKAVYTKQGSLVWARPTLISFLKLVWIPVLLRLRGGTTINY